VLCAAEDGGCRWTGPRAEQDAHEATCMWGRAEAPSVRTQVSVFSSAIVIHLTPSSLLVARQLVTLLDFDITVAWKVASR